MVIINRKYQDRLQTRELEIDEPGVYCLIGGNGTGKSTILSHLLESEDFPDLFNHRSYVYFNRAKMLGDGERLSASVGDDVHDLLAYMYRNHVSEGERLIANLTVLFDAVPSSDCIIGLDELDSGLSDDRCKIVAQKINALMEKRPNLYIIVAANHYSVLANLKDPKCISLLNGKRIKMNSYEEWLDTLETISKITKSMDAIIANTFGFVRE